MKTRVKVCGMTRQDNCTEVSEAGADILGFIFYKKSLRYIAPDSAKNIFVPSQVQKSGVFVHAHIQEVLRIAALLSLDYLQIHGRESAPYCKELKSLTSVPIVKAFAANEDLQQYQLDEYEAYCDYFLFDTHTTQYGGSGKQFNWHILDKLEINKPFFLSGGIGLHDAEAIREFTHKNLYCIDVNSQFEQAPGIKKADEIKIFIDTLKK